MDDHRSADALIDDDLDRDVAAALAVDPSPEFVSRVRRRVQVERNAPWPAWPWGIAAAAGAVVVAIGVVAAVVGMPRANGLPAKPDAPVVAQAFVPVPQPHASVAPTTLRPAPRVGTPVAPVLRPSASRGASRKTAAGSNRRSVPFDEPVPLIAPDEARALQRLFSDLRQGHLDLSALQAGSPAAAALQPPSDIAFQPITFEPIAAQTAEEGERQ